MCHRNEILEIADRRAWEVTNMIYNNDFSMYRALKAGVNVTKATDSNNPEIQRIFTKWNTDNRFDRKARMYCDLYEMPRCFWRNATLSKGNTRITMMLWEGRALRAHTGGRTI